MCVYLFLLVEILGETDTPFSPVLMSYVYTVFLESCDLEKEAEPQQQQNSIQGQTFESIVKDHQIVRKMFSYSSGLNSTPQGLRVSHLILPMNSSRSHAPLAESLKELRVPCGLGKKAH